MNLMSVQDVFPQGVGNKFRESCKHTKNWPRNWNESDDLKDVCIDIRIIIS